MSDPVNMSHCPTEETLAAFIDGRLEGARYKEVIEHIADCAECRDTVLLAGELDAEDQSERIVPAEVLPFRRRPSILLPAFAVAASVVIILSLPVSREWIRAKESGGLTRVVSAYNQGASRRKVEPRFSGGFSYKRFEGPMRGADSEAGVDPELLQLYGVANDLGSPGPNRSWKELRSIAEAHLLIGERDDVVPTMESAAKAGGDADPQFLSDLAAVYLERAPFTGRSEDLDRAVELSERAWERSKTPECAWNRALAYEKKERTADAVAAWQDYLRLDPSSQWAGEARQHLARLQEPFGTE